MVEDAIEVNLDGIGNGLDFVPKGISTKQMSDPVAGELPMLVDAPLLVVGTPSWFKTLNSLSLSKPHGWAWPLPIYNARAAAPWRTKA